MCMYYRARTKTIDDVFMNRKTTQERKCVAQSSYRLRDRTKINGTNAVFASFKHLMKFSSVWYMSRS